MWFIVWVSEGLCCCAVFVSVVSCCRVNKVAFIFFLISLMKLIHLADPAVLLNASLKLNMGWHYFTILHRYPKPAHPQRPAGVLPLAVSRVQRHQRERFFDRAAAVLHGLFAGLCVLSVGGAGLCWWVMFIMLLLVFGVVLCLGSCLDLFGSLQSLRNE